MKKIFLLISLLGTVAMAQAGLIALDNQALGEVQGQAGADLSLKLALNQTAAGQFDNNLCRDRAFCHIALSLNNRYVQQQSGDSSLSWSKPDSNSGRKLWLVFKGVQGSLNIQKLGLDGVDLRYQNKQNNEILKPSMQLSFTAAMPIQIRNFGFDALSIEQDSFQSSSVDAGSSANAADHGYLKASTYSSAAADMRNGNSSQFDQNKEVGFTGMKMHGNLALNGKVMVFSCDGSHPRC